jgi:AraC-like DNA-binding protein
MISKTLVRKQVSAIIKQLSRSNKKAADDVNSNETGGDLEMVNYATQRIHSPSELQALVTSLNAEGVTSDAVLHNTGIKEEELTSPTIRTSIAQMMTVIDNATRLSKNPHLGLNLGLSMQVSVYGMYGFALLSSASLRAAAQFSQKYQSVLAPLVNQTFDESDGEGVWTIEPFVSRHSDPRIYDYLVELGFGSAMSLGGDITDDDFRPSAIRLTRQEPTNATVYIEAFGCPVFFGQPLDQLLVDANWLDRQPTRAHATTFLIAQQICDGMIVRLKESHVVTKQLQTLFVEGGGRLPSIEKACRILGLSGRSLRRKLADEGTNYQALLDEMRLELAKKYLNETELTVEEIASRLEFSDASNFRQAFRRWSHTTPNDFRAR